MKRGCDRRDPSRRQAASGTWSARHPSWPLRRGERRGRAARADRPKIGTASLQHGESSRCAQLGAPLGSWHTGGQASRRTKIPRYVVQRTFPDGLQMFKAPRGAGGAVALRSGSWRLLLVAVFALVGLVVSAGGAAAKAQAAGTKVLASVTATGHLSSTYAWTISKQASPASQAVPVGWNLVILCSVVDDAPRHLIDSRELPGCRRTRC